MANQAKANHQLLATPLSHRGKNPERPTNQDYVAVSGPSNSNEPTLLIVCDGMGGHSAGELASRTVGEALIKGFRANIAENSIADIGTQAFEQAHRELEWLGQGQNNAENMGTTAVVAVIGEDSVDIFHIGDSRAYLAKGNKLQQLTVDHSQVGEMVRAGLMTAEQAKQSQQRHLLSRAILANKPFSPPEHKKISLGREDVLLLCTDGLWDVVSEAYITRTLFAHTPKDAARRLVNAALKAGGPDNVSVIVAAYPERKLKNISNSRFHISPLVITIFAALCISAVFLGALGIFLLLN